MFDRFTDRAKKILSLSRKAAIDLRHGAIDAHHVLLGVIDEGTGIAASVLMELAVDLDALRSALVGDLGGGRDELATMGQLPFTTSAKRLLESALGEAQALRHDYIGSEHLLLGALRASDDFPVVRVLRRHGVTLENARRAILASLGRSSAGSAGAFSPNVRRSERTPGRSAVVLMPRSDRADDLFANVIGPSLRHARLASTMPSRQFRPEDTAHLLEILRAARLVLVVVDSGDVDQAYEIGLAQNASLLVLVLRRRGAPLPSHVPPQSTLEFEDTAEGHEELRRRLTERLVRLCP